MASILDRYGIKEVADGTFYELGNNGKPTNPVLYLDTLKVSTIEQTAEDAYAQGGKGNGRLIGWDFNKEITVTIEDALFSAKSLAIMFGDGSVAPYEFTGTYPDPDTTTAATKGLIMKTETFAIDTTDITNYGWKPTFTHNGKVYTKHNPKFYKADGSAIAKADLATYAATDSKAFCTYDIVVKGSVIDVGANNFAGTYYFTGDTFARSEASGKDEFFQFIIPRAKITSENTITLEADGDPSVFNMNLTVLRPDDGIMMKLVKYGLAEEGTDPQASDVTVIHNHELTEAL